MSHIFISYSSSDRQYADQISIQLIKRGFDVWQDHQNIRNGQRWFDELAKAVKASSAVVVIMTPRSEDSVWVGKEIMLAEKANIPIVSLLLEGRGFDLLVDKHFENVSGGRMPSKDFYQLLAEHVTRHRSSANFFTDDSLTQPTATLRQAHSHTGKSNRKRESRKWWPLVIPSVMVVGICVAAVAFAVVATILANGGDNNNEVSQPDSEINISTPTIAEVQTQVPADTPIPTIPTVTPAPPIPTNTAPSSQFPTGTFDATCEWVEFREIGACTWASLGQSMRLGETWNIVTDISFSTDGSLMFFDDTFGVYTYYLNNDGIYTYTEEGILGGERTLRINGVTFDTATLYVFYGRDSVESGLCGGAIARDWVCIGTARQ